MSQATASASITHDLTDSISTCSPEEHTCSTACIPTARQDGKHRGGRGRYQFHLGRGGHLPLWSQSCPPPTHTQFVITDVWRHQVHCDVHIQVNIVPPPKKINKGSGMAKEIQTQANIHTHTHTHTHRKGSSCLATQTVPWAFWR